MSGQYKYDTTGNSNFFFLTALLVFLLPVTFTTLRGGYARAAARVPAPCVGWNAKGSAVKRAAGTRSPVSKKHVLLAIGWLLFAVVVQRASQIEPEGLLYDPFQILGISLGSDEKQIKKHYRRMSLKFHPDKLVLAENQTKEEADNHFVELTKAYKSLTDETARRNFELFGHPDGKQEYSQGIALPSWVVESTNIWWVMGAYALTLGVMLPFLVGRWWYGSRKLTKDGVLNSTATTFFHGLTETITFGPLLDLLAASDEFVTDAGLHKHRKAIGKAGIDEYAQMVSLVRSGVDGKEGWEGFTNWSPTKKRARVLISAHLLRMPIKDLALLREKQATVALALPLTTGLTSISLARNWLSTTILILHAQQFLLQAVHPSSSALLQLPHMTKESVAAAAAAGITEVRQFGELPADAVGKIMQNVSDAERHSAVQVAKNWPVIEFVDAKFQVVGEKIVTPGSIVSFTVKLRVTPPGHTAQLVPNGPAPTDVSDGHVEEGEESTIEELIGRRTKGADGEEPTPLAHAPEFPLNRKPTWYIFVGDHKLNRVFVAPQKFTDLGPNHVRTIRISFQAPPGPGLYTFQAYVMNDSFVGTDIQRDIRMIVNPTATGEELDGEEDDISEPDEDTIAGQMALMKGQAVRRIAEDSDDTSGTDDDEDSSDSDSSDSD